MISCSGALDNSWQPSGQLGECKGKGGGCAKEFSPRQSDIESAVLMANLIVSSKEENSPRNCLQGFGSPEYFGRGERFGSGTVGGGTDTLGRNGGHN